MDDHRHYAAGGGKRKSAATSEPEHRYRRLQHDESMDRNRSLHGAEYVNATQIRQQQQPWMMMDADIHHSIGRNRLLDGELGVTGGTFGRLQQQQQQERLLQQMLRMDAAQQPSKLLERGDSSDLSQHDGLLQQQRRDLLMAKASPPDVFLRNSRNSFTPGLSSLSSASLAPRIGINTERLNIIRDLREQEVRETMLKDLLLEELARRRALASNPPGPVPGAMSHSRRETVLPTADTEDTKLPATKAPQGKRTCRSKDLAAAARNDNDASFVPRIIPLAIEADKHVVSSYQKLLRESLEFFEVSPHDNISNAHGRDYGVKTGQVGLRCQYCAHRAMHWRGRGSLYFPSKVSGIYQAAQNLGINHLLSGSCAEVPADVRSEMARLRESSIRRNGGGKRYWEEACRSLGLYDMEDTPGVWLR